MLRWRPMLLLLPLLLATAAAESRSLEEIRDRGRLTLCAYPDALPFSSDKGNPPGLHLELGNELAAAMGVQLKVNWIVSRRRTLLAECDLGFDEVEGSEARDYGVIASRAYQRTGVALAVSRGGGITRLADVTPRHRVGVPLGSDAETYFRGRGLNPRSFALALEMQQQLEAGELDAVAVQGQLTAYQVHRGAGFAVVHAWQDEPALAWNVVVSVRRGDAALMDAVNRTLDELAASGWLAAMYDRYGIPYVRPQAHAP